MKTYHQLIGCVAVVLVWALFAHGGEAMPDPPDNPVEIGTVRWQRDFSAALTESTATGKPIFLLFQEVPGCIGCKTFGLTVLSDPLLVEAIEDLFIPTLVYNNRFGGKDEALLRRYQEPSWNFQVIRFLDGNGDDIIPRRDQVWSIAAVAERMISALQRSQREVPLYLQALRYERDHEGQAKIGFGVACFWVGEYLFGAIPGVVTTEAGWYGSREITLVTFHRQLVDPDRLVSFVAENQGVQGVYLFPGQQQSDKSRLSYQPFLDSHYRIAAASDQKKQLQGWQGLARLDNLTPMQRTKLNALWPENREAALQWLSPRQRAKISDLVP